MKNSTPIKLIAEIGWNHMGDMNLAKKMINAASKAGADYVKFQAWSVKNLKPGPWDTDGRREIYKKAELSREQFNKLNKYSRSKNIKMTTSIFNIQDYHKIEDCKFSLIKIPSHEIYNLDLIKFCEKKFKTLLVSAGAAKWSEILKIKKVKNFKKKIFLLHCVSSYPCLEDIVNLKKIDMLKKITNNLGYSGHFNGIEDAIFSMTKGVKFIEKHFTIDNRLPGRDNKFAILPKQMKDLSDFRYKFEKMDIYKGLGVQKSELDIFKNYRGRWGK